MTFNISYCGTLTELREFMISAQMAVHYIFASPLLRRNRFSGPPDAYKTGAEGGGQGGGGELPTVFSDYRIAFLSEQVRSWRCVAMHMCSNDIVCKMGIGIWLG